MSTRNNLATMNKLKDIICLLLVMTLCMPAVLRAQQSLKKIDSLLMVEKTYLREDTLRVILLKNIALKYAEIDPDKGIEFADRAIALALKLDIRKYIVQAYQSKGYNYQVTGNTKEAMHYYQLCLKINEQANDKKGIAFALHEIGTIFLEQLYIWEAVDYLKKSLAIYTQIGDTRGIADCNTDLAGCAYQQGDYSQTLDYLFKALPPYIKLKDPTNIANIYYNIGLVYKNVKDYTKSTEYYQKALALEEEMGYKRRVAGISTDMADNYTIMGDFARADSIYLRAVKISNDMNDKKLQSLVLVGMGQNEVARHNAAAAIPYIQKSLALRKEIGYINGTIESYKLLGAAMMEQNSYATAVQQFYTAKQIIDTVVTSIRVKSEVLELLSKAYLNMKKFDSAYYYFVSASKLKDSIDNDDKLRELTKKGMQYEFDKKTDSIHFENTLAQNRLQQMALLSNQKFLLSNKEKELQQVTLLKTQTDLKNEQLNIADKERLLALTQKEKELQQQSLYAANKDRALQKLRLKEWRLYGFGILLLLTMGGGFWYYKKNKEHAAKTLLLKQTFEHNLLQSRLETQEQTFNTISQEIHDSVGQLLSLAKVQLSIAEQKEEIDKPLIADIKNNISQGLSDLRDIAKGLNSDRLQRLSLPQLIDEELQRLQRSGALQCRLNTRGNEQPINEQKKTIVFRIAQECLQNIIKHANATQIITGIFYKEKNIEMEISDNGNGFIASQETAITTGLGLNNIKTRTALIGGSVAINSMPETGTTITLHIPYDVL